MGRSLIGAKARKDYEAFLYTGNTKENVYLCLHLNHRFPGLPYRFQEFCASNNISCEVVMYESPDFRFRFQNTEVHIEHTHSEPQRFYLGTDLMYGREFVTFYRMFRRFFEYNNLDLSPVDDLIFCEKLQDLIIEAESRLVGRFAPAVSPVTMQTAQVYEEMKSEAQELINTTDRRFKDELLMETGIDLYNALRKGDDKGTERLMIEYLRIASELNINPKSSLEAILNSN